MWITSSRFQQKRSELKKKLKMASKCVRTYENSKYWRPNADDRIMIFDSVRQVANKYWLDESIEI